MRFSIVLATMAASVFAAAGQGPGSNWPSFTGIVEVQTRTWDGIHGGFTNQGQPMVLTLGTALHNSYETNVDGFTASAVTQLKSIGMYNIQLHLEQDIDSITVAPSSHGIRLAAFLRKNTLHGTLSNNTIFGSYADPTFDCTFDLAIIIDLQIGPSTSPTTFTLPGNKQVTLQPVAINSVTAVPVNLVAKTGNLIVGFVKAFNLVDFSKMFPTSINISAGPFNAAIANALPFVQQAAQQGYTAMESDLATPQAAGTNVNVFLTKSNIPTSGNGTITGKVTWPASQGYPGIPDIPGYTPPIMDSLVAAFPLIQVEMPYTTYRPNGQPLPGYLNVGYVTTNAANLGQNGTFEVDYTVSNLPYNAPLYVTIADSYNYPAWVHSNLGKPVVPTVEVKVFQANGWQGFVTIFDPATQRQVAAPPIRSIQTGPVRPGNQQQQRLVINQVTTNPNGFGTVGNFNWTWIWKQLMPPGLTPIRLVLPGEAVQRFGSPVGTTTKAGG